eukprot:2949776-Rhodomonas_salina.2
MVSYGATFLRARYLRPGTEAAYGATRWAEFKHLSDQCRHTEPNLFWVQNTPYSPEITYKNKTKKLLRTAKVVKADENDIFEKGEFFKTFEDGTLIVTRSVNSGPNQIKNQPRSTNLTKFL